MPLAEGIKALQVSNWLMPSLRQKNNKYHTRPGRVNTVKIRIHIASKYEYRSGVECPFYYSATHLLRPEAKCAGY